MALILLGRGTTHSVREGNINIIEQYLRDINRHEAADTIQTYYKFTQLELTNAAMKKDSDTYLYVHPGPTMAKKMKGPDDPAEAAFRRAEREPSNVVIDTFADINVARIEKLVEYQTTLTAADAVTKAKIAGEACARGHSPDAVEDAIDALTDAGRVERTESGGLRPVAVGD